MSSRSVVRLICILKLNKTDIFWFYIINLLLNITRQYPTASSSTLRLNHNYIRKPAVAVIPVTFEKSLNNLYLHTRIDLPTPKTLIIQFHTSSVWKHACHTICIQFLKTIEKKLNDFCVFFRTVEQTGDTKKLI